MNSERGAANIRRYNVARQEQYLPLITEELRRCKRHKQAFGSLGKLAEYISGQTGIHRTTLIRNSQYKSLLVAHLVRQGGIVASTPDECASADVLRAKLMAAQLELSNLQEKNRRLEAFIARLGAEPTLMDREQIKSSGDVYVAFADTAMALTAVLERLRDTVSVNLGKKTIEDLAAPPSKRIVIGPERMAAYVAWLQEQKQLLREFVDDN